MFNWFTRMKHFTQNALEVEVLERAREKLYGKESMAKFEFFVQKITFECYFLLSCIIPPFSIYQIRSLMLFEYNHPPQILIQYPPFPSPAAILRTRLIYCLKECFDWVYALKHIPRLHCFLARVNLCSLRLTIIISFRRTRGRILVLTVINIF